MPVHFSEVVSLALYIESNVTPYKIQASLWNVKENTWTLIPMTWNKTDITDAWQYIGADGEIILKLSGDQSDSVEIKSVNFELMVQP